MIIECVNGILVNADLIKEYHWCDINGRKGYWGSGNMYLMGFYNEKEYVCLGPFHSSTDGRKKDGCYHAWEQLQNALENNISYLKFN